MVKSIDAGRYDLVAFGDRHCWLDSCEVEVGKVATGLCGGGVAFIWNVVYAVVACWWCGLRCGG